MVASNGFAEFLRDQLAPLGRITMRGMFGKTGQEAESFPPLNYEKKGGTIDLSFWRAPERLFDEPDEFVTWGRAALAAARCLFSTGTHAAGGTAGHRWDSSRKLGFAPDSPLEEAVSSELVSEMLTGLGGN